MRRSIAFPAILLLLVSACSDNPVLPDPLEGVYTAELTLSTGHIHILSEVQFSVTIRNGLGQVVTGLESVVVERRSDGGTWRAIEMTLQGQSYMGTYTFSSSGDYDVRVMVTRHGATDPEEVPLMDPAMGALHAVRAHAEVEGVRIEFESFPGHLHEGDTSTIKFWVMQPERDANGIRQPISGFEGVIVCGDPAGFHEEHEPFESETGVYEAEHTWTEAGDGSAMFRFMSADGHEHEAAFNFHVVHAH